MRTDPIAVSILTGFLGSGKTTLLNRLLKDPALTNTAVIINEFGEVAIDHLLVEQSGDGVIELSDGCLCCTVRGELVDGTTHDFNLMWRREVLDAELLHRPLVGSMFFFSEPQTAWAIHLLSGQAEFDGEPGLPPLQVGDSAWLGAGPRRRYALRGGGELLAVRVTPRGAG